MADRKIPILLTMTFCGASFMHAQPDARALQEPASLARMTLQRYDSSGDGFLQVEEFTAIPRREARSSLFINADENRDGRLSIEELTALMSDRTPPPGPEQAGVYTVVRDITYAADHERQKLDVYAATAATEQPVMVFIHGGGWSIGDKKNAGTKPAYFTGEGYVFVSVNYRLSPEVVHPAHVEDVARAIAWVHDSIASYGGDPDRIVVMGHSAGAHLAALVSTNAAPLSAAGKPLDTIKGTILLDGAGYDIPRQMRFAGREMRDMYIQAFTSDEAVQRDASPIHHVAPDKGIPPFLLIHVADRWAARVQSENLAEALRDANVSATVHAADGKTHMTVNRDITVNGEPMNEELKRFLAPLLGSDGGGQLNERTAANVQPTKPTRTPEPPKRKRLRDLFSR